MPSYGFDGTLTEVAESHKIGKAAEGAYRHVVWSGGDVTPGTGLNVSVSALNAVVAGIYVDDAAGTVSMGAAPTSNRRIDYIVSEVNWGSTASALGTPANSSAFVRVAGAAATSPIPPTLTQNFGSLWQMPLARVTVPAGATSIATANIVPCKPLTRVARKVAASDVAAGSFGSSTQDRAISTATASDPGWPYFLNVDASALFSGDSGYARIRLALDGSTTGTRVAQSPVMTTNSGDAFVTLRDVLGPLTGPHVVTLTVSASSVAAGMPFETTGGAATSMTVLQIPA